MTLSSSSSSASLQFSRIPFLKIETKDELHTAVQGTRFFLLCIGLNMLFEGSYLLAKTLEYLNSTMFPHEAAKRALLGCYMAWNGIQLVGGLAALFSVVSGSIRSARICSISFILMIGCQIIEVVLSWIYFLPSAHNVEMAHVIVLVHTSLICIIDLILCLFAELYISVHKAAHGVSFKTATFCDDHLYASLLDSEEVPMGRTTLV